MEDHKMTKQDKLVLGITLAAIFGGVFVLGFAGLLIYLTLNTLTKAPLETKNHPFLDESKHLHT